MLKRSFRYSFWNFFDSSLVFLTINLLWFVIHFFLFELIHFFINPVAEFTFSSFGFFFFPNETSLFSSLFFDYYFNNGLLKEADILLIKRIHEVMLLAIIYFFSPFSLSIWKLNGKASHKKPITIKSFFVESYRQAFRSTKLLAISSFLIIFCYINIIFYQSVFASFPVITYAFIAAMLFLELLMLICFVGSTFIIINEDKKIVPAIKRSYLFFVKFLPSTSLPFLIFFSVLVGMQLGWFSSWIIVAGLFCYPSFFGQFLNEHYLTSAEHFGLVRTIKEKSD